MLQGFSVSEEDVKARKKGKEEAYEAWKASDSLTGPPSFVPRRMRERQAAANKAAREVAATKAKGVADKKKEEADRNKEAAIYARGEQKKWGERRKEIEKLGKEIPEAAEEVGGKAVGLLTGMFRIVKGQKVGKIRRPIHPDKLIKNRELYSFGGGAAERLSPIGRRIDNPMELYFGSKAVEKDATRVLAAMESGASDINNISIMTGLSEGRIVGGLKYLKRQGYDIEFLEEV